MGLVPCRNLLHLQVETWQMSYALDLSSLQQLWSMRWEHYVTRGDQREEHRPGPFREFYKRPSAKSWRRPKRRGGDKAEGSTGVWAGAVCPIGSTEGSLGRSGL